MRKPLYIYYMCVSELLWKRNICFALNCFVCNDALCVGKKRITETFSLNSDKKLELYSFKNTIFFSTTKFQKLFHKNNYRHTLCNLIYLRPKIIFFKLVWLNLWNIFWRILATKQYLALASTIPIFVNYKFYALRFSK